jgi:hypothetical protein
MAKPQRDVLTAAVRLIRGACVFAAITLLVSIGMPATQGSGPSNTGETQSTAASPTTPATKAKKIWTNDDLDGASGSNASTAPLPKNSSDLAVFLTPHDGDVVQPGEVLQVNISVKPGAAEGPVGIISEIGDSNEVRQSPPYSFTMTVSRDRSVGAGSPLIGKHSITAFGKLNGRNEYDLASIDLDVEEQHVPTKLSVVGNLSRGQGGASFQAAGEQEFIAIYAQFPNGDEFNVIDSSYLKLVSENPNVVSPGERGMLTSVGPGQTSVTGRYTFQGQTLQVSLPVSVHVPTTGGLIPSPPSLNFGDQPAGRESAPLQVVLTNRSLSTIKIYKPEIRAAVREWDDCIAAPLPPGGTCTMSVTFFMIRPGRTQGLIFIPNSQSGQISIAVIGNGI